MLDARGTLMRLVAVSTLLCGTVLSAQTAPKPAPKTTTRPPVRAATTPVQSDPFIGVWRLSADKSKYESGGAPKGFTRTYEDRGNGTIFMTTDVVTAHGSTRSYLVYKRDGKPYPEAALGVNTIRLVTVKAVDRHTEELAPLVDGKPAENTITVSVSADGRTMTQVLSGKTNQGRTFTNTLIFDKQ
jgi:hypothetical protein